MWCRENRNLHLMAALVLTFACAIACTMLLAGCSGTDDREAGRVFDHVFTEQEVIDYIAAYREGSATTDDADWAAWMAKKQTTAEKLRREAIEYFAENWLVERAAQQRGVDVTDDEVQAKVEEQKSGYPSEMAWTRALINSGYTEDAYRMSVKSELLKAKIKETFADPTTVSDEELEEYANKQMISMTTRRSSAVFVPSGDGSKMAAQAKAQQAKAELEKGTPFADVFEKYSSTEYSEDGDMGFDFFEVPSLGYRRALMALHEIGEVSEVAAADDGYFVIVLTDTFEEKEGGSWKLSKFPEQLLEQFRMQLAADKADDAYNEFYTQAVSEAQVAVQPMPEGLPYDVPVPGEGEQGATGTEAQTESPDGSAAQE